MKKVLVPILMVCMSLFVQANAQTYYYTKHAVVRNGQKAAASGDGHYLTFSSKGLYESDENGYSRGCGFIRYSGTNSSGRRCYEGDGYLGCSLVYRIAADYSRINITLPDNSIAVYVRASAGSGRRRVYESTAQGSPVTDVTMPVSGSSSGHSSSSASVRTCPGCGGHGYIEGHSPSVSHFGTDSRKPDYRICPKCGHRYNANEPHVDVQCKVCKGTGVIRR